MPRNAANGKSYNNINSRNAANGKMALVVPKGIQRFPDTGDSVKVCIVSQKKSIIDAFLTPLVYWILLL